MKTAKTNTHNLLITLVGALVALAVTLAVPMPLRAESDDKSYDKSYVKSDDKSYDAELAAKVGADDYGMKRYVMAMLKRGPNREQSKAEAERLQRAHLDNIGRLAEEGKLVLAGPFLEEGDLRGIYIFNVTSVEEAKALTESDPAIKAGRLIMELHPWYGSAALMEVNRLHHKLAKKAI
ncbi:YciI family protein [Shewanella insulae]|uniref:YciI family protein n=1 Tax=Shewanella insulae TaxID=2681496 RepID=UPI001EFEE9F7|nr:YciI family protein [Shewanella insulae]MCG9712201.1 YciI family protein [Shewanella insulae]